MMHLVFLFSTIGFQRNPDYKKGRIESKLLNKFINKNYTSEDDGINASISGKKSSDHMTQMNIEK